MVVSYDELARRKKTFEKLAACCSKMKLPIRHRNELVQLVSRYAQSHYSAEGIVESVQARLRERPDWQRFLELLEKYLPIIVQLILALL